MNEPYQPTDRRPIAARRFAVFHRLANALAARGASANAISILGMIAALTAGITLWATSKFPQGDLVSRLLLLVAAAGIQLRLLANMIDGMVAIASGKASRIGELYNELPDRISDMAVLIGAGYAVGGCPELGYIAACLALLVAYIRTLGKAGGAANEFCGPMAKQQRMFVITLAALYLALTPTAWQAHFKWACRESAGDSDGSLGLLAIALAVIILGCIVTAIRRLRRIVRNLQTRSD